jgi:transposase
MLPTLLKLHWKTIEHLTLLKKESEREGEYRIAKRLHAIILNSEGRTSGEISSILKSPRSCVKEWVRRYRSFGVEGILEGARSGRPKDLTQRQLNDLYDIVESGPVAYGYPSGVWTSTMITGVINDEYGVLYHPGHVRKILYELNLSVQRPRKILTPADPSKKEKWRRYTFPKIKKKHYKKEQP